MKYTAKHVKKEQRQVNEKFSELGIAEKAKKTRSGMRRRYDSVIAVMRVSNIKLFIWYV